MDISVQAVASGVDAVSVCEQRKQSVYIYNEKYRPTKHRTSCDVTIADVHIAIAMLKRYIVQP